jgi:hypothetical protein
LVKVPVVETESLRENRKVIQIVRQSAIVADVIAISAKIPDFNISPLRWREAPARRDTPNLLRRCLDLARSSRQSPIRP